MVNSEAAAPVGDAGDPALYSSVTPTMAGVPPPNIIPAVFDPPPADEYLAVPKLALVDQLVPSY